MSFSRATSHSGARSNACMGSTTCRPTPKWQTSLIAGGRIAASASAISSPPSTRTREPMVEPLDEHVDHVRGEADASVILAYGDYECPYSRQAFRGIERVEQQLSGRVRFAFRHFPLTQIHPHAHAAAAAAEAAARQGRFWEMHALLFHRQNAREEAELR